MSAAKFTSKYGKDPFRLGYLVARFNRCILTDAEHDELDQWFTARRKNAVLFEKLIAPGRFEEQVPDFVQYPNGVEELQRNITHALLAKHEANYQPWYLATAVAVTIILVWLPFQFVEDNEVKWNKEVYTQPVVYTLDGAITKLDINHADTVTNNRGVSMAMDGKGAVTVLGGQPASSKKRMGVYVPSGYKYHVTLQDGTKWWFNAVTDFQFPETYSPKNRTVYLKGEAYVEANNGEQPLTLRVPDATITCSNCILNVKNYTDEQMEIVLLSGTAYMETKKANQKIVQGNIYGTYNGGILAIPTDSTWNNEWKNGRFVFKNQHTKETLNEIGRWYNKDFYFRNKQWTYVTMNWPRSEPFEKVLDEAKRQTGLRFTSERGIIYVDDPK